MPTRLSSSHETFSRLFGLAAELSEDALLVIGPDGLTMGLRDPNGSRVGWFRALPEAFETYQYEAPPRDPKLAPDAPMPPESYGIDLTKLHEYVKKTKKLADAKEPVVVELPDKNGKLTLKTGRSKVSFGLIDPRALKNNVTKFPNVEKAMEYRAICVVRGNDFRAFTESAANLVETMGIETVDLITREGKLVAACAGDVDTAEIIVGDVEGYLDPITNERREPNGCRSIFSLDLITTMCKALPAEDVTFKVGHDVPLIAHYADEGLEITGIVAGRIE